MSDALGYRLKIGVITPSVNTVVQPEYDDMRPAGVTNHLERIFVLDTQHGQGLARVVGDIDSGIDDAVERLLPCEPDVIALGVSIEAIFGDPEAGQAIQDRLRTRFDPALKLVHAGAAIPAALHALGIRGGGVGLLTPYGEQGEEHLTLFMKACGYEVHAFRHLVSPSTAQIAHNGPGRVRAEIHALDATGPQAIVQFGANLPAAAAAARAEVELGIPVIAVNTATYWHTLRTNGIPDRATGFGRLLAEC
jgi:maleate isomerase